jgi:cytochrome c-type biogenesis protein CcmH
VTAFAAIAAAMVVAAVAWVLVPLLRHRAGGEVDRSASNAAILRDQLRELDADLARGAISAEHHAQARQELERRVLEEVPGQPASAAGAQRGTPWVAALFAAVVPIAAVLLYLAVGSPEALGPQAAARAGGPGHDFTPEQVEKMVSDLAARLANEPDNLEGWVVLARTYHVLKRYDAAAAAYERALKLAPHEPDLLADFADALGTAQGGNLAGKPLALVKRALEIDPTHWKALALAGTEAFNRKDYGTAVAYWEKLRAHAPAGSQLAQSIDASIAEARSLGGLGSSAPPAVAAAPVAAGGRVTGTVALGAALRDRASPEDTVFVFARAADGPRAPLAILRRQVKDLPFEFALDDSMAMAPNMKLSSFPEVVVGARVSRSGNATPQSGDLEGFSGPVRVGASGVAVVIDAARP